MRHRVAHIAPGSDMGSGLSRRLQVGRAVEIGGGFGFGDCACARCRPSCSEVAANLLRMACGFGLQSRGALGNHCAMNEVGLLRVLGMGVVAVALASACGGSEEGSSGGGGTGGGTAASGGTGAGSSGTGGTSATGGTGGTGGTSGSGGTGGASGSSGASGASGSDAGLDASTDSGDAASDASGDASTNCTIGTATSSASAGNLNLFGTPVYFDNGADIPAGTYMVSYEDGCFKYGSGQGWTVNAYPKGGCCHWWIIGNTTNDRLEAAPGTIGFAVGSGAFAAFQDCVNASKLSAPVTIQHTGGKLGIWLQDSPYTDNTPGENGNNPKWKLTRVGACVDGGTSDAATD